MIIVRFDLASGKRAEDRTIARYSLAEVPLVGELVNVEGEPYQVIERGWSIDDEGVDVFSGEMRQLFAYLRVIDALEERA